MENKSDEILMQSIRDGNLAEMAILFERYHLKLFNFFLRMGLENEISQDLTQNLFYRMIKYRSSYKSGNSVRTWMYQIARNLHADYCKVQKRSNDLFIITETIPAEVNNEDETYHEDDYQRLEYALTVLSDTQRELIVMSRFQGLKYDEISVIVNQSVPAIKVAMHRAIKQLKCIYFEQV